MSSNVHPSVKNSCPIQFFVYGLPFSVAFWIYTSVYELSKFIFLIVAILCVRGLVKDMDSKKGGEMK